MEQIVCVNLSAENQDRLKSFCEEFGIAFSDSVQNINTEHELLKQQNQILNQTVCNANKRKSLLQLLHTSQNVLDTMPTFLAQTASLLTCANVSVYLLDDADALYLFGEEGVSLSTSETQIRDNLAQTAIQTKQANFMSENLSGGPYHSLCFPLYYQGTIHGVLVLHRQQDQAHFDGVICQLGLDITTVLGQLLGKQHVISDLTTQNNTDSLTRLLRRQAFMAALDQALHHSREQGTECALILHDVDAFKWINDHFGHQMGDKVLKRIATELKQLFRNSDFIGRYGGEEFISLLPSCQREDAVKLAEIIRKRIQNINLYFIEFKRQNGRRSRWLIEKTELGQYDVLFSPTTDKEWPELIPFIERYDTATLPEQDTLHIQKIPLSISNGIASYPTDLHLSQKAEALLDNADSAEQDLLIFMADKALYHAKNSGKNRTVCYDQTASKVTESV